MAIELFERWRASGREVAVVGLGKSGVAATRLLRHERLPVYASDTATGPAYDIWAAQLRELGAAVQLGDHDLDRVRRAAAVVVAPGVPPGVPPLEAARAAGLESYAEVDIGFLALGRTRCVGITGTNGKTTTTSLIAHVMEAAGLRCETAGNIGRPLCDVALAADPPDWLALELSSFQLHDAPHLRPAIGVLTNLAPNHLDRYHSLEEYYGDKALLFRNADAQSVSVSNADDAAVQAMVARSAGYARPLLDRAAGRRLVRPRGRPAGARRPVPHAAGRPAPARRPQRRQRALGGAGRGARRGRRRPRRGGAS